MRKSLRILLGILLSVSPVLAQTTTVTGTIVDSDSQNWSGATVSFSLFNPSHTQLPVNCKTGLPITTNVSVTSNSSGAYSATVSDNSTVCPGGTRWTITLIPNATGGSYSADPIRITGASQTVNFSGISAPRFTGVATYGYTTAENSSPNPGDSFFNVTNSACSQWSGSIWVNCGSGTSNVIPRVDSFAGIDFCAKLRAANLYAVANNLNMVDATHFGNSLSCSSDPLTALDGTGQGGNVPLTIMLPASRISTTVQWHINNSSVQLIGAGPGGTIIAYTGGATVPEVLTIGGSMTNAWYADSVRISNLSIIGHSANATDGLALRDAGAGKIDNVYTWGVTGCGIHTYNSVTETFVRPTTSSAQAAHFGYLTGYSVPSSGLCFDKTTAGSLTTDGTVIDATASGVSGVGWDLIAAQGMTFTGGTSESNASGLTITSGSFFNTFINSDLEANTANAAGVDISDSGYANVFNNVIAISACASCNSVSLNGSSNIPSIFRSGKQTSIGGTQGIQEIESPNFGDTFIGYGLGASLGAEYTGTASSIPFFIYQPNLASNGTVGECIGIDQYCNTAYNSATVKFNFFNSGNTANFWFAQVIGGPSLRWDGTGVLYAGYGANGTLGLINSGWWKSICLGSGASFCTEIDPPSSPISNNIVTLPSATGILGLVISGTTGSIGGSSLALNACSSGTATVTGATTGMVAITNPTANPNSGANQSYDWYAIVTATNTVTVYECAIVAGTPAATTFNVRVIQ